MIQFTDLGLAKPLLQALTAKGYTTPTPIQAQAIPAVLQGRDLLGIAQTGTGKTAAFALPILHMLASDRKPAPRRGCRVLILSPTRELATQISEMFRVYGAGLGLTTHVVFGGVKYGPQIRALAAGVDILVATPGRLLDHIQEKMCDLSETEVFVLDEADQMLDLGFLQPIRKIVSKLPQRRQNLFFSATMPDEIGKLAGELLRDPFKIQVAPQATTVDKVDQSLIFVEGARKRALLAEMFANNEMSRVIVFTRTKRGADRVAKYLENAGVPALAIHGDKSQGQRERALASFKSGHARALVATDIAARGIDIGGVTHVVNYELPNVPEAYVHRIGRTARAGAGGSAISLCSDDERNLLRDIQRTTRQTIPTFDRRNCKVLGAVVAMDAKLSPKDERPERPMNQRKTSESAGQPHRQRRRRPDRPANGGGQGQPGGQSAGQGAGQRNGAPSGGGKKRFGGARPDNGAKPAAAPADGAPRWSPADA